MALLEKAARQGHARAMLLLGQLHDKRLEPEQATVWLAKAAETGLPTAMFHFGCCLDKGVGGAAPDYPAAASWYKRAADAGDADAAANLSIMYEVGRGRAWLKMPATSSTFRSFPELNSILQHGAHYLPDSWAWRHAQQAAGDAIVSQDRR